MIEMFKEFIIRPEKRQEIVKKFFSEKDISDRFYSSILIISIILFFSAGILLVLNLLPQELSQTIARIVIIFPYLCIIPFFIETVRFILSNKDFLKWSFGILLLPAGSISLLLARYILISINHVEPSSFPVALSILTFFANFIIWPFLALLATLALLFPSLLILSVQTISLYLKFFTSLIPGVKNPSIKEFFRPSLINSIGRFLAIYLLYTIILNGNKFYLESIGNHGKYLTNITKYGLMATNYVPNSQECNNHNEKEWIAKIGDKKISVATPSDTGEVDFTVRNCDKNN
ncbi:MAG: hypothetical protein RLZZ135_435 [Cyanobacteriota bacterium]